MNWMPGFSSEGRWQPRKTRNTRKQRREAMADVRQSSHQKLAEESYHSFFGLTAVCLGFLFVQFALLRRKVFAGGANLRSADLSPLQRSHIQGCGTGRG